LPFARHRWLRAFVQGGHRLLHYSQCMQHAFEGLLGLHSQLHDKDKCAMLSEMARRHRELDARCGIRPGDGAPLEAVDHSRAAAEYAQLSRARRVGQQIHEGASGVWRWCGKWFALDD
jgi:hypothetical protein